MIILLSCVYASQCLGQEFSTFSTPEAESSPSYRLAGCKVMNMVGLLKRRGSWLKMPLN
jgi:hypothetical protein